MYSLTICFESNAITWGFLFKDVGKANEAITTAAQAVIGGNPFSITDEFGQTASFTAGAVVGTLLEDLDLTDEAKIIRSLANARNEVKARARAATDPTIRAGMNQQGPSVISPFPRG